MRKFLGSGLKVEEYKNTLVFDRDASDGGCIVDCGFCGKEFNEKGLENCPHCGKDLIFPNADW